MDTILTIVFIVIIVFDCWTSYLKPICVWNFFFLLAFCLDQ